MNTRLEIGRGLAALWVFTFHVQSMIATACPSLSLLAAKGFLGVPIFFVISGYAISASAEREIRLGGNWRIFMKRRLLRIYPPFWGAVVVAISVPFVIEIVSALKSGIYLPPEPRWLEFGGSEWLQVLSLTRIFYSENGDLQAAFSPVNAVFWTLGIEVQFYIVMAAAVASGKHWRMVLRAVTVISMVALFIHFFQISGLFLVYWPVFMLGVILRRLQELDMTPRSLFKQYAPVISGSMIAGIVMGSLFMMNVVRIGAEELSLLSGSIEFLTAGLATAFALWFSIAFQAPEKRHWLLLKPLTMLGVCSYSLYLIHGRVYPLAEMFVRQISKPNSLLYPVLTISGTIVVAYVFYTLVERPFMSVRNRS